MIDGLVLEVMSGLLAGFWTAVSGVLGVGAVVLLSLYIHVAILISFFLSLGLVMGLFIFTFEFSQWLFARLSGFRRRTS